MNKILNQKQIEVLNFFAKNEFFRSNFYWTGGTALAELFLKHRLSEDLDFFSDDLHSKEILLNQISKLKKETGAQKIKYIENKNRLQFMIEFKNHEKIKLEFVYFPFTQVKHKKVNSKYNLRVDSLKSIGENKVFALYETSEPKHAFDLYWIVKKDKNLTLKKLYKGAAKKFAVEIDKVIFLEKALEAIDRMQKIKPLLLIGFQLPKNKAIEFFRSINHKIR